MLVVLDRESGEVVLTHQAVHAGVARGVGRPDTEAFSRQLLKKLGVRDDERLTFKKVDPATWDGSGGKGAKPKTRNAKTAKTKR